MLVLSIKRKRLLINKLNNNGPKINPCGTPLIISYRSLYEEFTFVRCLRLINSYVLNLNQFYQCHRLQILQQEGHVASSHKL